ncbi:MAG: fucose isomerase, partial [Oscillospiraceae bacterium]|nr:fucose isomerase [Oscillospiraceae bacterium]
RMAGATAFATFQQGLETYLNAPYLNVLPPLRMEMNEEFNFCDELIDPLTKNAANVDVYVVTSSGRINYGLLALAQKTKKPIITLQFCCNNTTTTAMLRSRGFEGYAFTTWENTTQFLRILRVRKVLRNTNVLLATRGNSNMAAASAADGFISLEAVTELLGPHFTYVDIHELLDQTHYLPNPEKYDEEHSNYTLPGRVALNIDDQDMAEINAYADELIAGAEAVSMDRKYIVNSLRANKAVLKIMEHTGCNAFSAPCPEMCATRRLNQEQFTFCFNHSLNNENGIPSSCEYDIPGVLAMIILSNLSFSAPYLGNCVSVTLKADGKTPLFNMVPYNGLDQQIERFDAETLKHMMLTFHSVANRKLKGYDAAPGSYTIRPFTGSGWGATMRHNFAEDEGQVITMARVSPDAKSIFVAKGTIVGCVGYELSGCTHGVLFMVKDREDFFQKQQSFGNHMPLVYGDYVSDVKALAHLLGIQVVEA